MLIDINTQVASFRDMLIHIGHDKHDCPELRATIRKTRRACVESIKVARLNLPQFKRFEPDDRAKPSTSKVFVRKSRKFLITSMSNNLICQCWLFVRFSEREEKVGWDTSGSFRETQSWPIWFGKSSYLSVILCHCSVYAVLWDRFQLAVCPRVGGWNEWFMHQNELQFW